MQSLAIHTALPNVIQDLFPIHSYTYIGEPSRALLQDYQTGMLGHILRQGGHTRTYVTAARFSLKNPLQMDPHFLKETAEAGRTLVQSAIKKTDTPGDKSNLSDTTVSEDWKHGANFIPSHYVLVAPVKRHGR